MAIPDSNPPGCNISARTTRKLSSFVVACMLRALRSNGRCLQSHLLATGPYVTIEIMVDTRCTSHDIARRQAWLGWKHREPNLSLHASLFSITFINITAPNYSQHHPATALNSLPPVFIARLFVFLKLSLGQYKQQHHVMRLTLQGPVKL
jgi:hypothetical protein